MDIKNTAITATMVIQSLVKLLENEDVDISSVKFKVGSESDGYESPEFELEKLIDLAYEGLEKIKEQATPEGFVLVPRVITDEWMALYVDPEVSKYCKEFEGLPFAVTEKDLPMIQEDFRRPIKAAHSRLMKVIEAQEQSHE